MQSIQQIARRAGPSDWGSAAPLEDIRGQVAIAGVGETRYSGPSDRNAKDLCLEAIAHAIEDAGLRPEDIDGLMISAGVADQVTPEDFHAHFGTRQPLWFSQEGGGMIWAATSAHTAACALKAGEAKHIVNVFAVDWATRRAAGTGTPGDWHASEAMKAHFELPFGWFPQPVYFATFAHRYMHEYGLTSEQLAALPVTFRAHANRHPGAVMREKTLTVEDYLARPLLTDPLRVEDCCLISDGGAAYVYTTPERARDLQQTPVIVEGVGRGIVDGAPYISQQRDITATPQTFSAPWAFAMADLTPADLDVIAVYDCFSITALMQIEDMGLCPKGEGGNFIQDGRLRFDRPRSQGGIPCNTHGGLLSHAYVLGIAHMVELVKQLRGSAVNQVENAELAAYAGFTADEGSTLILRRG
jgi:acetyl-CoA acetyltransferase